MLIFLASPTQGLFETWMTYLHDIVKFRGVPRILDLDRQMNLHWIPIETSIYNFPLSKPTIQTVVKRTTGWLQHHKKWAAPLIPQKPNPQIKHGMLGNTEIAIEFDDLSIYKPPFSLDISQLAMFDDTRGYIPNTSQYYILGVLYLVKISPWYAHYISIQFHLVTS